jgi:hypothetical protein
MRCLARILLACVAAVLVGAGGPGLRALHLVTDAGPAVHHDHHGCDHHHHDDCGDGHEDGPEAPAPDHDDLGCATCELLLALATVIPAAPEIPSFLALVAVADAAAPPTRPAPPALRALAARPPPAC